MFTFTTWAIEAIKARFKKHSLQAILYLIPLAAALIALSQDLSSAERELDVYLRTGLQLRAIALKSKSSDFAWSKEYALGLENVVRFDLNQSGYFEVLPSDHSSSLPLPEQGLAGFSKIAPIWLKKGSGGAIYMHFFDRGVDLFFSQSKKGRCKTLLQRASLSGDLTADRQQMHRLTRQMHREWAKGDGISCCRLLYAQKMSDERSEIWECDFDGRSGRSLTRENSLALSPTPFAALGKGGKGMLYVSYKSGQPRIYYLAPGQQRGVKICPLFGNQFMPSYHMQTDRLALISDHLGHPEIYLQSLRPGRSNPKNLFRSPKGVQASPAFSPQGDRLAFVSNKDGSPRIYIANLKQKWPLAESDVELVSRKNRENTSPSWSPDGTKLAFCAKEAGTRQIWIFDFATRREYALTCGGDHKENPSWAPDSLHLAFNSASQNRAELFIIDLYRTKAVQISSGPGDKRFPNWQPAS